MSIFKDFPTIPSRLWVWLRKNIEWGIVLGVLGILIGLYPIVFPEDNDQAVAEAIEAISRKVDALSSQLGDTPQGEKAAIREAIAAIPKQTEIPDAKARIKEALAAAAEGNTTLAEAIFSEVEVRKVAEGEAAKKSAYKEAAEAARHRGALAFLHDTNKAISAYRRATELDPENADGWNRLGRLLYRTGDLADAEAAYRKVESLGNAEDDQKLLATAYGGLGNLYQIRGDLEQAESMYNKALALDEELGSKEGMAYQYGNLGILYLTRGELDQAEAMYRQALDLFQDIGARPKVEWIQGLLEQLRSVQPGK